MGNQLNNLAVVACLKILLCAFNLVFWLSGLILFSVGLVAEVELKKYMEVSPEFSGTAPHVIISIAALIVLASSIAFTCIIKDLHELLYVYGGFLLSIFMMEVGVGVAAFCYRDTFSKGLYDGLTTTISAYQPQTINLNFAQSTLECCGVSNYTDWMRLSPHQIIPISCCKNKTQCVTANYNDVYQRGCYEAIVMLFVNNLNTLLGLVIVSTLLPLLGALLSCLLGRHIEKSKYDVIN